MTSVDSASIYDAQDLHILLMYDTVSLDSLRDFARNQKCLNIPVDFESVTKGGIGRRGGLLHTLTSLLSSEHKYSLTSLHAALFFNPKNKFEVLSTLLASGADPNVVSADSITTLDWANIKALDLTYCDTLIKHGADPKMADLRHCDADIKRIDFFIEQGSNPSTINWSSFLTTRNRHLRENRDGNWKKNFHKVLRYGADPQKIDQFELRSFVRSNYYFEPEIMDSLISYGLDLNEPLKFQSNSTIVEEVYWLDYVINNHCSEKLLMYIIDKGARKTRKGYNVYQSAERMRFSEETLEMIESTFGK